MTFRKGNKLGRRFEINRKKKKPSLKLLVAKADQAFSQYIRHRDADGRGNCRCITCSKVAPIKEMHCGHFVSRVHRSLRWDERNAAAQCVGCNLFHEGRKDVFAVRLVEKHGPHILFDLHQDKQKVVKLSVTDLESLIEELKKKTKGFVMDEVGSKTLGEGEPGKRGFPVVHLETAISGES